MTFLVRSFHSVQHVYTVTAPFHIVGQNRGGENDETDRKITQSVIGLKYFTSWALSKVIKGGFGGPGSVHMKRIISYSFLSLGDGSLCLKLISGRTEDQRWWVRCIGPAWGEIISICSSVQRASNMRHNRLAACDRPSSPTLNNTSQALSTNHLSC